MAKPKGRPATPVHGPTLEALVVRIAARHALVRLEGEDVRCTLRKGLFQDPDKFTNPLAVGDRVRVQRFGDGSAVVEEVLPRDAYLARRKGATGKEQIMVANVDQVLITVSLAEPAFRPRIIDRILVAAGRGGFDAAIALTKRDLVEDCEALREAIALYEGLGYRVVPVSSVTGEGVEQVRELLKDRISVLAGQSGVGKSSLLNAVQPNLALDAAAISGKWGKGRHTTTSVHLIPLDMGGWVADTPGVRSFGIAGLEPTDIALFFREFEPLIESCRFSSCRHDHEPECAIKSAVEDGTITEERYLSYLRIIEGMDEAES